MSDWRLGKFRGEWAIIWYEGHGTDRIRRRYKLGTEHRAEAISRAPARFAELTKPRTTKVRDLWQGYCEENAGKAIIQTMNYTWRALTPQFGDLDAESVSVADCDSHTKHRRAAGISDGTIHTELGHLSTVLNWARKRQLIANAPWIKRPAKPAPKEFWLTRDQVAAMRDASRAPHITVAIHLLIGTGARSNAALELTWDRVDFVRRVIDLRNPFDGIRRKGRAVVPINDDLLNVLQQARKAAVSPYVIEYAGRPVKSLKRGLKTAARKAGIDPERVSAHVLRHSAAVWMAESGHKMSEIAQFLGHSNSKITEQVYARYSPDHLRKAAESLRF